MPAVVVSQGGGAVLDGVLERVTFANPETGYTIARIAPERGGAEPVTGGICRIVLAETGRWLAGEHPEITEPAHWTRQTCASWVAAVDRMAVGDYSQSLVGKRGRVGEPLSPKTKSSYLRMAHAYFRDLQEWEWIPATAHG